jgi:GrpB-like predicted nucleotidyltransferase (UPF0157 family)
MERVSDADQPIDDAFLIAGPEQRDIVLAPHDEGWSALYEAQRQRIEAALGPEARRVEHIAGRPRCPGLLAKPIIDVLVTVADVEDEQAWLPPLEAVGYLLRVREPWAPDAPHPRPDRARAPLDRR